MTFSSCSSGIGATIVLLAFIFDLIFFFIARSRINSVGGAAEIGNGLWLTLASWVMLFFSGCFYGFGRSCISKRQRGRKGAKNDKNSNVEQGGGYTAGGGNAPVSNTEAMRMEAIKAENERKARQAEQGLPAFPTQAEALPLRKNSSPQYYYETDSEDERQTQQAYRDDYRSVSNGPRRQGTGYTARTQGSSDTNITTNYAGRGRVLNNPGYIPLPPGRNPVGPYNNNNSSASNVPPIFPSSPPPLNSYPPQTHYAQPSATYSVSTSPPPMPVGGVAQQSQYLTPPGAGSGISQAYGHGPQESSCESSASLPDLPRSLRDCTNRSLCPLTSTWVLLIRPLRFHKPLHRSGRGQATGRVIILQCAESTQHTFADTSTTHARHIPQYPNTTNTVPATAATATATIPAGVQPLRAAHPEPNAVSCAGPRARRGSVAAAGAPTATADDAHAHPDARPTATTEHERTE
jgi:hypothetical protein